MPPGGGTGGDSSEIRDALRQSLAGLRGTALGQDLAGISEVRAMAGRVVEIRLDYPLPDLLDLLAQPELALLPRGRANGPFQLTRDGALALLRPTAADQRHAPDQADEQSSVRLVRLRALGASDAIARFTQGTSNLILGGKIADYPLANDAAGIGRRALRIDPVAGLFGLAVAGDQGWLRNPELREALAMAIDRDALATELDIREWTPTNRLIPASAADAPTAVSERWQASDMPRRRAAAAARLRRAFGKGSAAPMLRIALPTGPGADTIFKRLAADFSALGLKVQRARQDAPADLRLIDRVARYGRADWYLNQLSCAAARGLCSPAADLRAAEARAASDPVRRASLLADAEVQLTVPSVAAQHHLRDHVGRGYHRGNHDNPDDHIAPGLDKLDTADDSRLVEQQQQHRQQEAEPKRQNELHDQAKVILGIRHGFDRQPTLRSLKAKKPAERRGHDQVIGQRSAANEQHRRGQQERQKGPLFLGIKSRRNKSP